MLQESNSPQKCVMIVAGEASGDMHGANLVRQMRSQAGDSLFFCGVGGQAMRSAGVKIVIDASQLSVVGITEVIRKLPEIFAGMSATKRIVLSGLPDLLILVDFPDFNLRLAAVAKRMGIPVFYYIAPQVWAWRQGRVRTIRKLVDRMAVILPFEEEFFTSHGVPATFVGHPLLDVEKSSHTTTVSNRDGPVVGLLPGSRPGEVERHLPIMMKAAAMIGKSRDDITFLVSCAPSVPIEHVARITEPFEGRARFALVAGGAGEVLGQSTLVVTASGTVGLETALYGVPMVVIYRVSLVSYLLARALVRIKNISLVNLIAGREIVPELIQGNASAGNIAGQILQMVGDGKVLEEARRNLAMVREKLGGPGASARAAQIALGLL